jgi:flagellar biosynthetic protein FliO
MVLVLAFVVGLIYGAFHLLKKISSPKDGGLRFVEVLETRNLAAGRNLHLVEVGNQILLVGSSDGGVSLVAEITDRETIDAVKLKASEAAAVPRGGNFADLVKGFLNRRDSEAAPEESLDFIKKQRDRLKKLP